MYHIRIIFIWNKQERFLETQNLVYNKGIVESVLMEFIEIFGKRGQYLITEKLFIF